MPVFPILSKNNKVNGALLDSSDTSVTDTKVIGKDKKNNLVNIPLENLQTLLNPASLSALSQSIPENNLLGRFTSYDGKVETISLGPMFSVDDNLLSLNTRLSSLDMTGNPVLTGRFPKYRLRSNTIWHGDIQGTTPDKLLGRADDKNLQPQEINVSGDFVLDDNSLEFDLVSSPNYFMSGFVFMEKTDSFIAEMNHIYYIPESSNTIYVECNKTYVIGNQFKIINMSNNNVVIVFKYNAKEMNLLDDTRVAHFVCGPVTHEFHNVSFTTLRDIFIGGFGNIDKLTDEYQLSNSGNKPYNFI